MARRKDQTTKIALKVATGTGESGATYKNRNFSRINPALADDDALSIGTKLAGLQTHPLHSVIRTDAAVLASD